MGAHVAADQRTFLGGLRDVRAHMVALCDALGIDFQKCFLSFPQHGNVGPAAVPLTLALADEAGKLREGDHVALMGIGSGLNVSMMSVTW